MVTFAGIDHLALTVSDLNRSEQFYTDVLDFVAIVDFGYGRLCIHPGTGFTIGLMTHENAAPGRFSELVTGLDHLALVAGSRGELEEWQDRLQAAGVEYTPIRDMELGHHLNFRDPDNIALELFAPNEVIPLVKQMAREGRLDEVKQLADQLAGADPGAT
ncbi:MAG: VOC family protein [Marmoricola sp.]|nr:VOC family protein [Marmoricola sp.]